MMTKFTDGLRNIVANLGTDRDKASHSHYVANHVDPAQLDAMYRSSAIARKIIDLPAEDSLREWREWQGKSDTITLLEAEEKRLGVQGKLIKTLKRARLYGGAALFIGTGDKDLSKPLDPSRIGKGGLKYVSVINRRELAAGEIEQDPREPFYGLPKMYTLVTGGVHLDIHPTRLVIAAGDEIPDEVMAGVNYGWSDPVLNAVVKDVTNLDATVGNVASLIFEAKIDIIGINGFNEGLRSGGQAFENMVLARATLTAKGKSINSTMVMDKEDAYHQKSASFATLPDIITKFMQMTSAAASIPMTLLFGTSPGGLNATGESDTRGYYDRIKVLQTLELEPSMAILDECIIRSATGNREADLHYNWRPLWQPTTKERADTGKTVAETFKTISELGVVPEEAIANGVVNAITETGLAPGFEQDYKKFGGFETPPTEGNATGEFEEKPEANEGGDGDQEGQVE